MEDTCSTQWLLYVVNIQLYACWPTACRVNVFPPKDVETEKNLLLSWKLGYINLPTGVLINFAFIFKIESVGHIQNLQFEFTFDKCLFIKFRVLKFICSNFKVFKWTIMTFFLQRKDVYVVFFVAISNLNNDYIYIICVFIIYLFIYLFIG